MAKNKVLLSSFKSLDFIAKASTFTHDLTLFVFCCAFIIELPLNAQIYKNHEHTVDVHATKASVEHKRCISYQSHS